MTVTKEEVLQLIDQLTDGELRIVYTFIQEYRIAVEEEEMMRGYDEDKEIN
ncbi:hypothetical protein QA612_01055 [Evansella sp. AB-P1]|uniref:hypothetical protein n=1 Tax=Evansella sp. AB-P1 TaxID=3037653 RepID=UPI00241BE765|nr:hypothetical protein [Evansella sp. AB-P1]MDG5786059.1 hypothetical protein [Evansella sp. AB-P1]